MSYFSTFDLIKDYRIADKKLIGIDITKRVPSLAVLQKDETIYVDYTIKDGETAEILSDRMYDTVNDFWIILVFNNIIDEANDWPLDQNALVDYAIRKYENPYATKHYVSLSTGTIVDSDHPSYDRKSVSYMDYETELNDKKRNIKIPLPQVTGTLKQLFRSSTGS